jgi:hypothetical protein
MNKYLATEVTSIRGALIGNCFIETEAGKLIM